MVSVARLRQPILSLHFTIFNIGISLNCSCAMTGKRYRDKSIRLPDYDYRKRAAYFVTICTSNRIRFFGHCSNGRMSLSEIGKIAHNNIIQIPDHCKNAIINRFVVMPDHIHLLIILSNNHPVGALRARPQKNDSGKGPLHARASQNDSKNDDWSCVVRSPQNNKEINQFMSEISPEPGSLSVIIRSYKSSVTRSSRRIDSDFCWQSGYYDRIIRNRFEFINVQRYIQNNPEKW